MTDTTAKIRAKGLEATGITEEIAGQLFNSVGRHFMAIVELEASEPHGPNTEGKRRIDLTLRQVEPAMNDDLDAHLRELTRTLYYNRKVDEQGPTLDGPGDDIEPDLQEVLAAGRQHEPHPYLASTLSTDDDAVCDVCGHHEAAAVHDEAAKVADPFTLEDEEPDADEDQGEDEDHDDQDEDQGNVVELDTAGSEAH